MNSELRKFIDRYWILLFLIGIKLVLQYVLVNPVYELHRDEFLYLNQADHLAFGYISVPPFTALISKIIYLFGGGIFWIRLFPGLCGAFTIVLIWLVIESIGGSLFSNIIAASALVFSALIRINILYQPNSFDVLIWTTIFFCLIKFIQSEKSAWLFYLSVIIAAGFYNKYNVIFLLGGLFIGFLATDQRKIFINPSFWKALIISLIILSPNIIWQVTNHFPVFQHMKVLKANQLDNNSSTGFLMSQLAFFIGSLVVTLGGIIALFAYKPFKLYRFIAICFITVLALFAYMKAKDYYSVGLYPIIIAFGSVWFGNVLTKKWRVVILPLLICINLGVFIISYKLVYPVYTPAEIRQHAKDFEKLGLLRWEDGKNHNLPQDFADMLGWKEMAQKSLDAFNMIPAGELSNTLVICNNYGQAGALNYYNRKKMPAAYSFNTDYIYWMPHLDKIDNILLVGEKPGDDVISLFREFKQTDVVENEYAREKGTGIYLLIGANSIFTEAFYKKTEERKKKLEIF
jgi:hypothetical protein